MARMVCVWLPNWAVQRLRHERPELRGRPVVLFANDGNCGPRVAAWARSEAQRGNGEGIKIGMPVAEAEALLAGCDTSPRRSFARAVSRRFSTSSMLGFTSSLESRTLRSRLPRAAEEFGRLERTGVAGQDLCLEYRSLKFAAKKRANSLSPGIGHTCWLLSQAAITLPLEWRNWPWLTDCRI